MKQPLNFDNLITTGDEPMTSTGVSSKDTFAVSLSKGRGSYEVPTRFIPDTGRKQVSVTVEADYYALLRHCADRTGMNHKEIFLEAFELWVKANAVKLR